MSLLRPLPSGTSHTLKNLEFLPPFVRARLEYLADIFGWYSDDEEEEEEDFTYYEVRGKLSDGNYTTPVGVYISPINVWIASDDNCNRSFYIGGSSCWICPDSHSLYFDAIDPTLLQDSPDPAVWWCIQYEEGIKVIKILVCPSEEITEHFPDGV